VRVDIDRHVELDGGREQSVIARMIEEAAFGRAVHQRADEAQVLHGADKLGRADVGALHRQRGKAGETVGMARHSRRQVVVHLAAIATPSEPGTRSAPGPEFDSTPIVMPASSSISDASRRSRADFRADSGGRWAPSSAGSRDG